jgi:Peptidase M50B-like
LTGGQILSVSIDPNDGGATRVEGGHASSILSAGYIGSSILGGIFILASFDTLAAKIMSFIIGFGLLMPLSLVRDKLLVTSSSWALFTEAA